MKQKAEIEKYSNQVTAIDIDEYISRVMKGEETL